jgi:hypothetical protein
MPAFIKETIYNISGTIYPSPVSNTVLGNNTTAEPNEE